MDAERAHFCARPRPARFWFPYAGMPDLVVRPAKSDLRLKIAYGPPRDVCAIAMTQMPPLPGHGPHLKVHGCYSLGAVDPTTTDACTRYPKGRHTQSRGLSCRGIRLPDRSNAPVVGRHQTAGQERLFAATIGTTGFHRTGRPSKTGGDLNCWASCPLGWQNERTARPGGASEGAGLSPDVSSPLIGRPVGRTRVPSGFRPRGFSRPAVAGVGRRARRAWKLKTPCGSGEPRSTVFRQQLTYLHPVLERSLFPHGECSPRFAVRRSSTHSSVRS